MTEEIPVLTMVRMEIGELRETYDELKGKLDGLEQSLLMLRASIEALQGGSENKLIEDVVDIVQPVVARLDRIERLVDGIGTKARRGGRRKK